MFRWLLLVRARFSRRVACGLTAAVVFFSFSAAVGQSGPSARLSEPVVLHGADLSLLRGAAPGDLVAFRYQGAWQQIPVQVDERAMISFAAVYNNVFKKFGGNKFLKWMLLGQDFKALDYTDPGTFSSPDPDPTLDADDEVVFMAADAGAHPAAWQAPPGVVAGSATEIELSDPLETEYRGFVYLFRSSGKLDPSAGKRYVHYDFKLQRGDYKNDYALAGGGNPEDSTIASDVYKRHFSDRWISDGLAILPPLGTGVNLLDRDNVLLGPTFKQRSIKTFSAGEGAFTVNKSGPVRAIRSYVGANSGPLTQRIHYFYQRREVIETVLRVHPIPGVMCLFDYSQDAKGMTYANNNNPQGVIIDGKPDAVKPGPLAWEVVSGKQGALVIVHRLETDVPHLETTSYYRDEENPNMPQLPGDGHAYGLSGPWINQMIPVTDPLFSANHNNLTGYRTLLYQAHDTTAQSAARLADQVLRPLAVHVSAVPKPGGS